MKYVITTILTVLFTGGIITQGRAMSTVSVAAFDDLKIESLDTNG
jgi:hypothetical protein